MKFDNIKQANIIISRLQNGKSFLINQLLGCDIMSIDQTIHVPLVVYCCTKKQYDLRSRYHSNDSRVILHAKWQSDVMLNCEYESYQSFTSTLKRMHWNSKLNIDHFEIFIHEHDEAFNDMVFIESLSYFKATNLLHLIKPLLTKYVVISDTSFHFRAQIEEQVKKETNKFMWINMRDEHRLIGHDKERKSLQNIIKLNEFTHGSNQVEKVKEWIMKEIEND
jgi:hypothetical protein